MPVYEYCCDKCGKKFSVKLHMAEHEEGHLVCPDCKSEHVIPQYSPFYAKTSKKS